MFQFRRFPSYAYLIQRRMTEYCSAGFPHSVISGSKDMCSSPKLIAACHDLHRLLMPRHSPCALISLTFGGTLKCRIWFSFRIMQIITEKFNSALNCFTQLLELPQFLAFLPLLLLALTFFIYVVQFSRCKPSDLALRPDRNAQALA